MDENRQGDVTKLLHAAGQGAAEATDQLLPLVYSELRKLAEQGMVREPAGLTLQPTALVHEAYLRLVHDPDMRWDSRAHFFVAAATAMRRILIERARRVGRIRHGGALRRVGLEDIDVAAEDSAEDLIALDAALDKLANHDERKFQVVMLRYFSGLTIEETSQALKVSVGTVKNDWSFAKAWLYREVEGHDSA